MMPARLEQRHLDVAGLTLIAAGVYLTLVLWLGWDGGRVGGAADEGLSFAFGKVAYLIPVALFAAAAALILKPFLPAIKPLRTGGICLIAGLLLAFAAQTAGLGPDRPPRPETFDSSWFPHHGGIVGESLYWATSTLFQRVGAHIVAVLLIVAGCLLLTGTSIATVLSAGGRALRRAGEGSGEIARTVAGSRRPWEEARARGVSRRD